MAEQYIARRLTKERVEQAYPLVQTVSEEVSLKKWHAYADAYLNRGSKGSIGESGIVCVENEQGYIHGLLGFRVDMTLRWGRTLICEHLIALHLVNAEPIITTIIEKMDALARDLECEAIHVTGLHAYSTARTIHPGLLLNVGYELETIGFCRRLEPSEV